MARDFWILIWGLIFVLVDFHFRGFDLFPDFVGFGLIGVAAGSLTQYAAAFSKARNLAWPLVGLAVLFYLVPVETGRVLASLGGVLTIFLVWFLLGGVMQFTEERERRDLAKVAGRYRRIFAGLAIFAFLISVAAWFEPEAAAQFVALMALVMVVYLAFLVRLLVVVKGELAVDSTPGIL